MSSTSTKVASQTQSPLAEGQPELDIGKKEKIYDDLQVWVNHKTGKNIGKEGGKQLFDTAVKGIFEAVVKEGAIRFNRGFGGLKVKTYPPSTRRIPTTGEMREFGERHKVRYVSGKALNEMVEKKYNTNGAS